MTNDSALMRKNILRVPYITYVFAITHHHTLNLLNESAYSYVNIRDSSLPLVTFYYLHFFSPWDDMLGLDTDHLHSFFPG